MSLFINKEGSCCKRTGDCICIIMIDFKQIFLYI
jgi:hypothetical protein